MRTHLASGVLLAAASALLAPGRVETPSFDVPIGTRIEREFELEHFLELKALRTVIDGVEVSSPVRAEVSSTQRLLAFDEVRACGDGRPTVLRRLFDALAGNAALRPGPAEGPTSLVALRAKSPLEGVGVVYTWVPEEGAWGRYFDALEIEEGALAELRQDLDALAFLPPKGHADRAWSVPSDAVRDLLAPAGELSLEFDATEGGALVRPLRVGLGANLQHALDGRIQGAIEARWLEPREKDGRRFAVAAVEVKASCAADQSARYRSSLTFTEFSSGMTVAAAQSDWSFEGTGELVWDLATGHLASLDLEGTQSYALRWSGTVPSPEGGTKPIEESVTFEGTLHAHGGGALKR